MSASHNNSYNPIMAFIFLITHEGSMSLSASINKQSSTVDKGVCLTYGKLMMNKFRVFVQGNFKSRKLGKLMKHIRFLGHHYTQPILSGFTKLQSI